MTLLPHGNRDVKPLSGGGYVPYTVGPMCCVPGCSRLADHAHHLWRRSFIGGDHAWVRLWDGSAVGNLVAICWRHHEEVTVGKMAIVYRESERSFYWASVVSDGNGFEILAPIFPQPPMGGEPPEKATLEVHEHGPASNERCPSCNQVIKEKKPREPARRRKTWVVAVPADDEDGALVLDTLLDEVRDMFNHDETENMRYFTLVQALAWVVQHQSLLVKDSRAGA